MTIHIELTTGFTLEWGITPPLEAGATAAWGARAIYQLNRFQRDYRPKKGPGSREKPEATVDIVWDRKAAAGDERALKQLCTWLDKKGLKRLRQLCHKQCLTQDSDDTITITDGKFTIVASPRGSYGYLYLGAWVSS